MNADHYRLTSSNSCQQSPPLLSLHNQSENCVMRRYYPLDFLPRDTDVIIGKGAQCYNHYGNKTLRSVVFSTMTDYDATTCKREKSKIVTHVLEQIQMDGSFIKKDINTGRFFNVDAFMARDKISQAFRFSLNRKKRPIRKKNRKIFVLNPQMVAALNSKKNSYLENAQLSTSSPELQMQSFDGFSELIKILANSIPDDIAKTTNPFEPLPLRECFQEERRI